MRGSAKPIHERLQGYGAERPQRGCPCNRHIYITPMSLNHGLGVFLHAIDRPVGRPSGLNKHHDRGTASFALHCRFDEHPVYYGAAPLFIASMLIPTLKGTANLSLGALSYTTQRDAGRRRRLEWMPLKPVVASPWWRI